MSHRRRAGVWSAHQLAEFIATTSDQNDLTTAINVAMDHLCETFDAVFCGVVRSEAILGSLGFGARTEGLEEVIGEILAGERREIAVPGVGRCAVAVATYPIDGVPIHLLVGRVMPTQYDADEIGLLRSMARVLGMSIRTFRLVDSLRERQRLLERLSVIQRSIARRAGLDDVLTAVTVGVVELLDTDVAQIRLLDPDDPGVHVMVSSHGLPEQMVERMKRAPVGDDTIGTVLKDNRVIQRILPVTAQGAPDGTSQEAQRLVVAAPVHDVGKVVGAIIAGSRTPGRASFTDGEIEALELLAAHAGIALADARAVEAMERAMYDPLTHLPNRTFFRDRLATARAQRPGTGGPAVLFLDLDGFKQVNDTLGHAAGDDLLTDVALRLSFLVRPGDVVARHGGDEFTILIESASRREEAEAVAMRVLEGLREPFTVAGSRVRIGASIGIAFDAGDAETDLVELADAAMYAAKQGGRGRYHVYDDSLIEHPVWTPDI